MSPSKPRSTPDEPIAHPAGSLQKIRTMRERHGQRLVAVLVVVHVPVRASGFPSIQNRFWSQAGFLGIVPSTLDDPIQLAEAVVRLVANQIMLDEPQPLWGAGSAQPTTRPLKRSDAQANSPTRPGEYPSAKIAVENPRSRIRGFGK